MNQITLVATLLFCSFSTAAQNNLHIQRVSDFELALDTTGTWKKAEWITITSDNNDIRATHLKTLYSNTGIYFLFRNEDKIITASRKRDFDSLWLEDVAEIFLWPDTSIVNYLEYEISPLNKELVMLITNINGKHSGWQPWQYTGTRRIRHNTTIVPRQCWYAEIFIPFRLMYPMVVERPARGTRWKANFYRSDRDNKQTSEWSLKKTIRSFHEYDKFGCIVFD